MIYVLESSIKVQGYKKLFKVSDDEIVFSIFKRTIFITGKDLSIDYFEADEFSIIGQVDNIKFE